MSELKCLEHSTLKVPYEILNKKFRAAQKTIDREVSHVKSSTTEIENLLDKKSLSTTQVVMALDGIVAKLSALKRKAALSISEEQECAQTCKRRVDHLKQSDILDDTHSTLWKKKRLDRMLVEYFLRLGYYGTATRLAKHSNIEDLTDIGLFLTAKEVEESLQRHDSSLCLLWCHENKSKLRKIKSSLEFNVRQQEFVELIRQNKRLEAIGHARKYLNTTEPNFIWDIKSLMGLLAYPVDTTIPKYRRLLEPDKWDDLIRQFRLINFRLHQLNSTSMFTATLQVGLSALKTHQCYKDAWLSRNTDCPVCSPHLNELAKPLPFSHSANSKLICFTSGESLNGDNPPVMLPNGYIYSSEAVSQEASKNGNKFTCPRTKEEFVPEDAEKVYIM